MASVDIRKMENLTVTLNVTREFKFRVWAASQLFRLATWILGGKPEIVKR